MAQTFSTDLFRMDQIRLAEISVFNWGSFKNLHTAQIDPEGTLITGGNGSGKTTLLDGLMVLLMPAGRTTFNIAAAQGGQSDRTLITYMRGSYGSAHDGSRTRTMSTRSHAVISAVRALYRGDDGSEITLIALFWTNQAGNAISDVKRLYLIAKYNLDLKSVLDTFGDANVRALKRFKDDPRISYCDEVFSDYQDIYRQLLYMHNKNAPALLSRALGLKKIDDLTTLIRDLVLEPSTIKEDARKVVDEFHTLVRMYHEIQDTRAQVQHLEELPRTQENIQRHQSELRALYAEQQGVSAYFNEQFVELLNRLLDRLHSELLTLQQSITEQETAENDAKDAMHQRHTEYVQHGGDTLSQLKSEIQQTQRMCATINRDAARYQSDVRKLGLAEDLEESVFNSNQETAQRQRSHAEENVNHHLDAFGSFSGDYSRIQKARSDLTQEIQDIQARPDSNVDIAFQNLKEELCTSLSLSKETIPYIAELIEVSDNERAWQGAIERALGGLRTTMLVPSQYSSMITQWLNARHLGLHIRVQTIPSDVSVQAPRSVKPNGFLQKLVWREHPYTPWLRNHLAKFDLECVPSTEVLNHTAFSMTQQGLIHKEKGRYEKKDQHAIHDKGTWQLGFSNTARLTHLQSELRVLEQQYQASTQQLEDARQKLNMANTQKTLWESLAQYTWERINLPYWQNKLEDLEQQAHLLETQNIDLETAKKRWEQAQTLLQSIQNTIQTYKIQESTLKEKITTAQKNKTEALSEISMGVDHETRQLIQKRIGVRWQDNITAMQSLLKTMLSEIGTAIKNSLEQLNQAEKKATHIMSSFRGKDKWQPITLDWPTDLEALDDFVAHYHFLQEDGLPALEERFKARLNDHTTQSLANIKSRLDSEREEILDRINIINTVLQRTEFQAGTHLKLGTKNEKFPHVIVFEQKLREVFSSITSEDHEERFKQLEAVMQILDKASTYPTSASNESLQLLDPRYQMTFFAEEIDPITSSTIDVLNSSSGKSGGEKEAFSGMILAASLAYVLTPEGYDKPVYCSVFLDEAFSNTAEAVSRRVLKVFKELHLHVNLITPYKNLNLAREFARSLIIAERNPELHESRLCEITWTEIDRKIREHSVESSARRLGIEIHEPS